MKGIFTKFIKLLIIISIVKNFNVFLNNLDLNAWAEFCKKHGRLTLFHKGELFSGKEKGRSNWGVVAEGEFAYTIVDSSGNEKTVGFAFPNELVGNYAYVVNGHAPLMDIYALSDGQVYVCDVEDYQLLCQQQNAYDLANGLFMDVHKRFLELYQLTPKERYLKFVKESPDVLQKVSLKQLASYLMITPTHLSRIRKEISKE